MSSAISLAELGERLHTRLCVGDDPVVTNEIVEEFLPRLINSLRLQFLSIVDEDLFVNAATDALLDYFDNPAQFLPVRGSLLTWLKACAHHNMLDLLKRQKNYREHEKLVELADFEEVYQTEAEAESLLIERRADEMTWQRLRAVLDDPLDLKLAWLMVEGVRETYIFADVLGILDKPIEEQQKIVKQNKDRLKKTIQRHYKREK